MFILCIYLFNIYFPGSPATTLKSPCYEIKIKFARYLELQDM